MNDLDDWNADIDAWRLTPEQRRHHLRRVHRYHSALLFMYLARYQHWCHVEGWLTLVGLVALIALVVGLIR